MLKRLLAALFEGVIPGAAVAYGLGRLGLRTPATMYAAVAVVGVLTGLIAGRPIWARAAKTEAALKAAAGAFISVVVLYALRKWLPAVSVDLTAFGGGAGAIGSLPWVFLPGIGVALALVLEIDDAFGADPAPPRRVRADAPVMHEPPSSTSLEEREEADVARARRRG
ncbi:MAG TPA: hypothetical protein VHC69_05480 [Polyangiaceae bacterium]|nr:hypothetical protein [Polyangiaceae bacterium]